MASALAALLGTKGQMVNEEMVFGYSYREDRHWRECIRFNVRVTDGTNEATYAAGCATSATESPVNGDWPAKTWTPNRQPCCA